MEKAGRFVLLIKRFIYVVTCAGFLTACAGSAPKLPEDYSSVHAVNRVSIEDFDPEVINLSCEQIKEELKALNDEIGLGQGDIQSKRTQNQVAGYIGGVFFLPLLLATDDSSEAKAKIKKANEAKELLIKYQSAKRCPSGY